MPLAELYSCEVAKWDRRGLILYGIEETWRRKERIDHPQAWWVRSAAELHAERRPPTLQEIELLVEEVIERLLVRVGGTGV